jgi:uncharacterized protein (DUF302 family)
MFARSVKICTAAALAVALASATPTPIPAEAVGTIIAENGLVRIKSNYSVAETVDRLTKDIADKGIMLFLVVDQTALAAAANIELPPSRLLIFGNPGLGSQFITSNPTAGIDWPVRILVHQDQDGAVWMVYTDWQFVKQRHHITDRDEQFAKATMVVESIMSAAMR